MAGKSVSPKFLEVLILSVIVVGALLFVTWQLASRPVPPEAEALHRDVAFLASEVDRLRNRLRNMESRQTVLEREADVLRQANRLLREDETARQSELNRLRSEVDFYRRLAGTGGVQEGLDVYRAELAPTESPLVFRFELTLTQNIRRAAIITGRAQLEVEGVREDRPVTMSWDGMNANGASAPAFRFKYFQQLDGYLTLPEGFSPIRLNVTLESPDLSRPVRRQYDWEILFETEQESGGPAGEAG